ncbi:MAG: hypothetical protein WC554_11595 [Clostridia bacterium]|jgi:hypothetical protein
MRYNEWWAEVQKLREKVNDNPFGKVRAGVTLTRDCGLTRDVMEIEFGDKFNEIIVLNNGKETFTRESAKDYTLQKAAYAELLKLLTERTNKLNEQKEMILAAIVQDQIPEAAIMRMEGNKDAGEISYEELLKTKVRNEVKKFYYHFEKVIMHHPLNSLDMDYSLTIMFQEEDPGWMINLEKVSAMSMKFSVGTFSYGHDNDEHSGSLKDHLIFLTNLQMIEKTLDRLLKWLSSGKNL